MPGRRLFSAAALALAASPVLADVSIGVLMPLSGKGAAFGAQQTASLKMFEEALGALKGSDKIKFVIYDTRGENTDAINLTRKLVQNDRVVAVIGPLFSGEAEVAFPIAVQGKTPMISPTAAKPGIAAQNRPYAFRNALTTDKLNGPLIDKWVATAGKPIKNVVVLVDGKDAVSKSDGTAVFPEALKKRGLNILETISFQTGDIDYSAQVTRAKGLNPDGIVVAALYNEGANVVREIRKQGMQQPVVASLGIMDPRFIQLAGPAAEGVMTVNDFFAENSDPGVVKWVSEFNAKNKMQPSNAAALMYDTLEVTRACILSTGVTGKADDLQKDRDKIQKCWAELKGHKAPVTGETTMTPDGEAVRAPVVLIVKDGKFVAAR